MGTVFDIDAHVEEWAATFSDTYFDPAQRHLRPTIVTREGSAHWLIQDRVFPKLRGRGANFFGTPTGYGILEPTLGLWRGGAKAQQMERIDSVRWPAHDVYCSEDQGGGALRKRWIRLTHSESRP